MVTPATITEAAAQPVEQTLVATPEPVVVTEAAPAPVPAAVPAVVPTLAPALGEPPKPTPQEELNDLRRQVAQANAAKNAAITEATLQRSAQAVYDEELAAGLSAEDALRIAQRHYQTSAQAMFQQQVERDRQAAAEIVGKKFGVPPAAVMSGTSGEHMEEIAQRIVLERRIAALEKERVPAQKIDATGSRASNIVPTDDNIDKLWFDFEREHPGAANPYDAAYRKAMER